MPNENIQSIVISGIECLIVFKTGCYQTNYQPWENNSTQNRFRFGFYKNRRNFHLI